LIRALKERGSYPAAEFMAAAILAGAPKWLLTPDAVLVPVPADPWRRRVRGIDHARVLSEAISRRSAHETIALLGRAHGRRQARLDRAGRVSANTVISARSGPAPATAVLIDDVHTTGATLHAAATALTAAGTGRIGCLTFGRSI
jgi:predicted amidophosphoribosyltransferase